MTDGRRTSAPFAEFALDLDEDADIFVQYTRAALGADQVGVLLFKPDNVVETAAATDPLVAKLDAAQMEVGEGPDISMAEDVRVVTIIDTETETRWPRWTSAAREAGIRSMLGVRIHTHQAIVGSLNAFSTEPDAFDAGDRDIAQILASHVAIALRNQLKIDNLGRALDTRKLIGVAQGMLMERYDLDVDRAFAVLLRASQHRNIKLRVVAEAFVDTGELP